MRTDLTVGVPLSEGTALLVLLACDYRFRLLHVGNALPVSVPSEPTRGSELRFIRCAVVASTSSEHDETVTDSATLPSIARQLPRPSILRVILPRLSRGPECTVSVLQGDGQNFLSHASRGRMSCRTNYFALGCGPLVRADLPPRTFAPVSSEGAPATIALATSRRVCTFSFARTLSV